MAQKTTRSAYQLTPYSPGSLKEILFVSIPLILSLLSASVMLFADRLLLSRYSVDALNAATSSGTAAYAFIIFTMSIASISGVFVGRYHGKGKLETIGKPVWQMAWYSILLFPLCIFLAYIAPSFIFLDGSLYQQKTAYFSTLVLFTPIFCINMALSGFFTGTGKLKQVLFTHISANIVNILLDILLINGYGFIPSYGITGAAIATGISEVVAIAILSLTFFRSENRRLYGTLNYKIDIPLMLRSIQVGFPSGLALAIEVLTIFFFYQLMEKAGQENATIASLVQTMFFLIMCLSDGLSKGVAAISSNFLGAGRYNFVHKLLKSASLIQVCFYIIISCLILPSTPLIVDFFFTQREEELLVNAAFLAKAHFTYFLMTVYFLLNGLAKLFSAQLTAAGDTRYLLISSIALSISTLLIPVYIAVEFFSMGVIAGWAIISFFSFSSLTVFYSRYSTKNWVVTSEGF